MAEDRSQRARRASYLLSIVLALALATAFFAATSLLETYSPVARYGGAAWVLLLSLIIALPVLTPLLRRRIKE